MIVIIIGLIITAVFIAVFSSKLKWEQNEQRYLELKQKQEKTLPGNETE
jgi:hypothetical protein